MCTKKFYNIIMEIKRALVPKKNGGGSGIIGGYITTTNNNPNIDTNNFNATNIIASTINTNSLTATNANIDNINVNTGKINELTTNIIKSDDINGLNFNTDITTNGNITNLSSETDTFDKTVDMEQVNVKLGTHNTFDELTGNENSSLYASTITANNLNVLGSAHFFELVLDKIKASGGSVLFSAADGFKIDKVVENSTTYTLYWRACSEVAEGDVGDTISDTDQTLSENVSINMWKQWDQAYCQTFNLSNGAGTYQDISNTLWWRVVESVSDEPEIQIIDDVKYYCHWINVYKTGQYVATDSDIPVVGNEVAQLGYRYTELQNPTSDDIARSSAIMINAYRTIDTGVTPPSYAQYQNITGFSLTTGQRKTYIDATGAHFVGNLEAGTTIDSGVNIPVVIDTWRIITDSSIVTKDINNGVQPTTITLSIVST